ncbi:MAG: RAD55 family ATPase [Candidatus Asgardarchaeia archaeon]
MSNYTLQYYVNFPEGVLRFLRLSGVLCMIKGDPGTGKTSLGLEIAINSNKFGKGYFISTRQSAESIEQQFKWLRKELPSECFIDATMSVLPRETEYGRIMRYVDIPDFLKKILRLVEEAGKTPVNIVLDSLDALKVNLEVSEGSFNIEMRLADICRNLGANLFMIKEGEEKTRLDYIADVIFLLRKKVVNGRLIRYFSIEKNRFYSPERINYPFTLNGARFGFFKPINVLLPMNKDEYASNRYKPSRLIKDLNRMIGNAIKPGCKIVVEYKGELGPIYRLLFTPLIEHLLRAGKKAIFMPIYNISKEVESWFSYLPDKLLKNIYVFTFGEKGKCEKVNEVVFDQNSTSINDILKKRDEIVGEDSSFFSTSCFFLRIVSSSVKNLEESTVRLLSRLSERKDYVVLHCTEKFQSLSDILPMATAILKIEGFENVPIIYGIRPSTENYVISISSKKLLYPDRLIPIR